MARPKTSLIIPVFNESRNISRLLDQSDTAADCYEILVIDDGSADTPLSAFKNSDISILRHPYNLGNGAAIKTGIRRAGGNNL